jgi:predicted RNA-binding Zn-ribbon protein involved in translation (DUF1610 family)
MKGLTAENVSGQSVCPDCGKQNRLNLQALTDSDGRIYSKWLVCGHCGWDQRGSSFSSAYRKEEP